MSKVDNEDEVELDTNNLAERRTLWKVLGINLLQVAAAGIVGVFADSAGLIGSALDNLGDAAVYIVSLYAVGRTVLAKSRAARLSGVLLIISGLLFLVEVIRRFLEGSEPIGIAIILTAIFNAASNLIALRLLKSHRGTGVHLDASWIFTSNDMIANAGIIVSGILVIAFHSPLPDLIIGVVVVGFILKGGWEILEKAREAGS